MPGRSSVCAGLLRSILLLVFAASGLLLGAAPVGAQSGPDLARRHFEMEAATDTQPLRVVLAWSLPPTGVVAFNLYRSQTPGQYPSQPLHGPPLRVPDDCSVLQQAVPQGSQSWRDIAQALADASGPFDPCESGQLSPTADSTRYWRLQLLASADLAIATGIGRAYTDTQVQQGTTYYYELRAVDAEGNETEVLATDVEATAGQPPSVSAPANLGAQAGDSRVFLTWEAVAPVRGYHVYRARQRSGPYQRVNEQRVTSRATQDLTGQALRDTIPAFLDYQRFTAAGDTTTHTVDGRAIGGPLNGTQYFYKVAAANVLGQAVGSRSQPVAATPVDSTAPATPQGVTVTPAESGDSLQVSWTPVEQDVEGRVEIQGVRRYYVYRYQTPNDRTTGTMVAGVPHPPNRSVVSWSDTDPNLRSPYGEETYYYRVQSEDVAGNQSAISAAGSGYLEDIVAPRPPSGLTTEGADTSITVTWDMNTEPDLDGYTVYRSRCHFGQWVPCSPAGEDLAASILPTTPPTCSGPFREIGRVSRTEAEAMLDDGERPHFRDHTMNNDSPLCYAYLVKARDESQNESGSWPPDTMTETILCERLRDKTPPEPAVITGLDARADAIRVEWIGPPIQDVAAYHVYRSTEQNGTYRFVGGKTVLTPSTGQRRLRRPFQPPSSPPCSEIPVDPREDMSAGHFVDSTAAPKTEYWYRVVGIDQRGNQVDPKEAAPTSTFTYSAQKPAAPALQSVQSGAGTCTLEVRWTPAYDPSVHDGFAVFRSTAQDGPYRQVSPVVEGNAFVDDGVACDRTYWYKAVALSPDGHFSSLSSPRQGQASP